MLFMINIGCWNIRGLYCFSKQKVVREWIIKKKLNLFSLVETKMHETNLKKWQKELELSNWRVTSNVTNNEAARIIVGWYPGEYDVVSLHVSSQWITCRVHSIPYGFGVIISVFYG